MRYLTLMFALASAGAYSQDITKEDLCVEYSKYAQIVMYGRQVGTPMSDMIKVVSDDALARAIVIDAYNQTNYLTDENRKHASVEFGNQILLACLEAIKND